MNEDEDTRLIAEYPGYPVAVVPTQSSRTAEICWVNNKITLGSKPVQSEANQSPALNDDPDDKVNIDNVCKHCNVEFADSDSLIKHLSDLLPSAKKTVKRKIEKPKIPEECQLSKKSKVNDTILKRNQYSRILEDNRNARNQSRVEPSTSKNVHLMQQISSTNASASDNTASKKNLKVRFRLDDEVKKSGCNFKCKQCNTYFGDNLQLMQHKFKIHPKSKDKSMFMKLSIKDMKKPDNQMSNFKAKNITASKKERKNERKKPITAENTLSYLPEVVESLFVQNKVIRSRQHDRVDQTKAAVHPSNKIVSDSKPKKNSSKKIEIVTAFNNHDQTRTPVKVMNSEKTELFKSECGLHFISYKSMQKHDDVCNGTCETQKIICRKCEYLFPSDLIGIHQSKHHNDNQINIFDIVELAQKRNELQCKSCTQNFTCKNSYHVHVLECRYKIKTQNLSSQKVLYKCFQCNLHYTSRAGLKIHLKNNHLVRYVVKKCSDCKILLSNRSFEHHVKIHHNLLECDLNDLTINSNEGKISSSKTQTNKTAGQVVVRKDITSLNKNAVNKGSTDSAESNIVRRDNANEKNISMINNVDKEITNKPTDILSNILYKCHGCEVHFTKKSEHQNHVGSKNCPNSTSNETKKCPKCHLVFFSESVTEHVDYQHLDNFKTSNDFLIICNDTAENQSLATSGNKNENDSKELVKTTKKQINKQRNNEEVPLRKSSEPKVKNLEVYDKTDSVKPFAEAWMKKCTEISNFASVDFDSYSNFLYRCYKCTLNFLNLDLLKLHESECKGDSFEWAQCPICCYNFSSSSLTLHIYVHHTAMELKRENFLIKSPELCKHSLNKPGSNNIAAKKQSSTKKTQNKTDKDKNQTKSNNLVNNSEAVNIIRKRSVSEERINSNTKPSDLVIPSDSSTETKEALLSDFKSLRAKIAWAIDNIEDSNTYDYKKSPTEFNEEQIRISKENGTPSNGAVMEFPNDQIVTSNKVKDALNDVEKDVSEEIDSMLSALDEKSKDKTNDETILASNKNTDIEEDVQINQVFEDIDSLVASLDNNSKTSKLQEKNIVLYKCNICFIHFMTSKSLQTHALKGVHNPDRGTNCNICHLSFNKNTITKHITNHHEKMNGRPLNYTIKTDFRSDLTVKKQQVVSCYFKNKQVDKKHVKYAKKMLDMTRKPKTSMCKVLKRIVKKKATVKKSPVISIQTQNPILKKLLNDCERSEKQQDVYDNSTNKELHSQPKVESNKVLYFTEPTISTLVRNSSPNILEIIEHSSSESLEVDGDIFTCPVPSQLICKNYAQDPNKRKFSIDSNVTKCEMPTKVAKSRTRSQEQSHMNDITNYSSDTSKVVKMDINTETLDKIEKGNNIVVEKAKSTNNIFLHKRPPQFQPSEANCMPITSQESVDINRNASAIYNKIKLNSSLETRINNSMDFPTMQLPAITINKVVSLETIDIMDDTTEYKNENPLKNISEVTSGETLIPNISTSIKETGMNITPDKNRARDVFLKQSCQKFISDNMGTKSHSAKTTDSSCIQKSQTPRRTFITFEDSNFEIRAIYENSGNINMNTASKVNIEDSKERKNIQQKSEHNQRDCSEFPSNVATSTSRSTKNTHQKGPVDIIDITEETNCYNTVSTPGTNSNKHFSATLSKSPDMTVEQNRTAFDGRQSSRPSTSTVSDGVPTNTPMALPSATNFNLFNIINNRHLQFLPLLFQQQSILNDNQNHTKAKPKQNKTRVTKNHRVPQGAPNIFDNMKSCPICRCSDRISSIKQHLKVKRGFFSCCFCARKSTELELINHMKICGSQINFNSYR